MYIYPTQIVLHVCNIQSNPWLHWVSILSMHSVWLFFEKSVQYLRVYALTGCRRRSVYRRSSPKSIESQFALWFQKSTFITIKIRNGHGKDKFWQQIYHLSFFLPCVANIQYNHWIKRVASTQLITYDPRNCPGPLPTYFMADPLVCKNKSQRLWAGMHSRAKKFQQYFVCLVMCKGHFTFVCKAAVPLSLPVS